MELRFNATEIGCVEENDVLVCGASNSKSEDPDHYVTFQQWADPDYEDDDKRIHFQIDDQINGNYDLLASCSVSRSEISILLLRDVPWHPGLERIVISCDACPQEQFNSLVAGLRRVFRDRPEDLHIDQQ